MIDHARRREERWAIILETLGDRCSRCRVTYPIVVYDLHHPDGKNGRNETPARIIRFATDAVFREHLKRWQLFCANCHRLHHAEIGNWHPARKVDARGPCAVCGMPLHSSAPRIRSHPGACRVEYRKRSIKAWKKRQKNVVSAHM